MKRRQLVRHLNAEGCRSVRTGGKHEVFEGPRGARAPLKRQREIPWVIAVGLCKQLGVRPPRGSR